MTTKINIHIEADSAAEARSQMIGLLGDSYKVDSGWREVEVNAEKATPGCANPAVAANLGNGLMSPSEAAAQVAEAIAATEAMQAAEAIAATEAEQAEAPKRERGKPSPGRARRTKEEIAEDEAADAAEATALATEAPSNISTGEERIDPTTAEDAAQDAADEAAEAETVKPKEMTHDDVRAALQKYVTRFGMAAAMEDGPKVFTMLFGDEVVKVSAVPSDQDSLAKAVAGIEEMLTKNPFKREVEL